jgi:hypothetical protein
MIVVMGGSASVGDFYGRGAWPSQIVGYEVQTYGRAGETTRQGLERFPGSVQSVLPEAVILTYGHADSARWETDRGLPRVSIPAFGCNLVEMIQRCRTFGAEPFLCSLTPSHRSEQHALDVAYYNTVIRNIATETDTTLIDVRSDFGDDDGLILDDGLSLAPDGHRRYAASVRRVLDGWKR